MVYICKGLWLLLMMIFTCEASSKEPVNVVYNDCSLTASKEARDILTQVMKPVVDYYGYTLPNTCIFHPSKDKFFNFEKSSRQTKRRKFKCDFCDKVFSRQEFLDQHFVSKHTDQIPQNATVCLADLCDILGCESVQQTQKFVACNADAMEQRKFFCQNIMNKCFPPAISQSTITLNELMNKHFCQHLTCDPKSQPALDRDTMLETHSKKWTNRSIFGLLGGILLGAFLVIYYAVVCVYRRETVMQKDLNRLSSERHAARLKSVFTPKKMKGY